MSTIQAYWLAHAKPYKGFCVIEAITCKDGFKFSVQASSGHYCSPREFLENGDYAKWEVGFPSEIEETLLPYCEEPGDPLGSVYGYVPTEVIDALIAKHGGIE